MYGDSYFKDKTVAILVRWHLYIEMAPQWLATIRHATHSSLRRRQEVIWLWDWKSDRWSQHCRFCLLVFSQSKCNNNSRNWYTSKQGWGQFHSFNSIPIPIPLFSIPFPIPIPLLTKSFNSNSNSNSRDFNSNSNSNSGDFKSWQYQFWKWPLMSSLKLIIIILTSYMYIRLLLLIPSVSYPLLNGYDYMASWWLMLYQ